MHVGLHTRLKAGMEERYDEAHRAVWPEVLAAMRAAGIRSWRIWRDGLDVFHAIDVDDYDAAIAQLAGLEVNQRWQAAMAPMMAVAHDYSGDASDRLPLIFDLDRPPQV